MKMISKKITVIIFTLAILLNLVPPVGAAERKGGQAGGERPRVIMVMVDRVSYPELRQWNLPNLRKLAAIGGQGLMTVTTGTEINDRNAYAAIGAGSKTTVPAGAVLNYNSSEEIDGTMAADIYRRNSGRRVKEGEIIQISLAAWLENTKKKNQPIIPGALGEVLHRAGKRTAVIGNSDTAIDGRYEGINRLAPLVAMDSKGRVDSGDVSARLLRKDSLAPFGIRTDYEVLWESFNSLYKESDLVVIETGDTVRLEVDAPNFIKPMRDKHRREALLAADALIGKLLPLVGEKTMLMVVTPLPPGENIRQGEKLTPLYIAGGRIPAASVLATPTTRRTGVVTYYDLAASIMQHLNLVKLPTMLGLPVSGVVKPDAGAELDKTYRKAVTAFNERGPMLLVFVIYQVLVLAALAAPLIFKGNGFPGWHRLALNSLGTGALAMLLLPILGVLPLWGAVITWVALTLILAALVSLIRATLTALFILGLTVSTIIITDVVLGSPLMRWSFLGYDLIVGGRFYGIGNEYMGVLIGSSILAAASLLEWKTEAKKVILPVIGLVFAAITFFFGAPNLGTNAGGALAAVVAYMVTMHRFLGWHLNWRLLGVISLVAVLFGVMGLTVVNKFLAGGQESHIGRAVTDLLSGNFKNILLIIVRKTSANWYLMVNSIWNKLVLAVLASLGWIYYRYRQEVQAVAKRYPALSHGMAGTAVGAIAALIFNDSGIVALATMSIFIIITFYYLLRQELEGSTRR